jgi:cytidylate kinase
MSVITIRGSLGSGAPEVGKNIAKRLQYDYVDREIIAEVAGRLERGEQEVAAKEMPPSGVLGRIAEALGSSFALAGDISGAYLSVSEIPLDDIRYLKALESVVQKLAQRGALVILGRGSQFILKDDPGAFHVLVVAPKERRIRRVMEALNVDQEAAEGEISHMDNTLHEFTKRYFRAELEDPLHYDLVINTGHLSLEVAASIVSDAFLLGGQGQAK